MKIVIDGAGEIGSHLAKMLAVEGNEVIVIDSDESRLQSLAMAADVECVHGNPTSLKTLSDCGVGKADLFISVYPFVNQEVNIFSSIIAKKFGAKKCIARVSDPELLSQEGRQIIKDLAIEMVLCPEKIAADEVVDQLSHCGTTDTLDFAHGKLQIAAFKLGENSPLLDMRLVDFVQQIPSGDASVFRVIAISRDGDTIIPKYDTTFRYGDLVYVTSKREGVKTLSACLGIHEIEISSVMIMGGGSIGKMAALSLSKSVGEVKVVDISRERCVELDQTLPESISIVNGDGRNPDFLYDEGIRNYDAFVAVSGNDEANILACVAAKKFGVLHTVAEVENIEYVKLAEDMGVDSIINKKLLTAGRIFKYTLSGRAQFLRYLSGTNAEVVEYTVSQGSAITKAPLAEINFPEDAVIGGVIRGQEAFIAVGSTRIQEGDQVAVFTIPRSVKQIDKFFK